MQELHELSAKDLEKMTASYKEMAAGIDEQMNAIKKIKDDQQKSIERMALLAWKLFDSNLEGKEFLEGLRSRLSAPVFLIDKPDAYGHIREGENSLIRWIISLIDSHKRNHGV